MEKKNDKNLPRRCLNDNLGTMGKYSYQYNIPRLHSIYIYHQYRTELVGTLHHKEIRETDFPTLKSLQNLNCEERGRLIHPFIHPFIHSFIHYFIHSSFSIPIVYTSYLLTYLKGCKKLPTTTHA